MSFKVTVQRLREMGPKKLGRSADANFYRNCFNDSKFPLKKGKSGSNNCQFLKRCSSDGPYFDLRAKIFHCSNEEICGRKGPKWILAVQGRHMHEILQKEQRFEKCRPEWSILVFLGRMRLHHGDFGYFIFFFLR